MKVLKANQLDNNSPTGFLISQFFFFFGSLPLTAAALIAFIFYKPIKPYRFIAITYLIVIGLFTIMKAKDYYAVGIYPVIIAFGSICIDNLLKKIWRFTIISLLIITNIVVFALTLKVVYPIYSPPEIREHAKIFERFGMLRWEDGKNHILPQDFADMTGWREMADISLAAYSAIPKEELEHTLIICNNYGEAGALNYYNRKKMPEAYSFNTDYIYWLPHLYRIDNLLIVGEKPGQKIIDLFKDCKLMGLVENANAREYNTGVYLLTGSVPAFTGIFYNLVEERKKKLDIF
jgi:hypothetical protein